jgi:hypothetical protein
MFNDKGSKDAEISWRSNDSQTSFYDIIGLHTGTVGCHWMMSGIENMGA